MGVPLIVLRPEPACAGTVAAARVRGLDAIAAPLFAIEPVRWEVPDPALFDGVLAGSANAFRCGGRALGLLKQLPVHAVGQRTADAARVAGFAVASTGSGGLQMLLDTLRAPQRLLRLAGEAHVALTSPVGITVTERVVYRAVPLALSAEPMAELRRGAVVMLHSGEAARAFAAECERLGVDRSGVSVAALAPRIAEEAGPGWASIRVAKAVSDGALLELAEDMCQ